MSNIIMSILTRVQYRGRSLSTPISVTSSTVTLVANRTDSFDQSSNSTCNYSNTKENRKKIIILLHVVPTQISVNDCGEHVASITGMFGYITISMGSCTCT